MDLAQSLPRLGTLRSSVNHLTYLDIDDAYIHQLYPMVKDYQDKVNKPAYFGPNLAGAHVTVIYPEENTFVRNEDLGQMHDFQVKEAYTADLDEKRYYILTIESETLAELRGQYGLPPQLCFKDHWLDFHITIASVSLVKKRAP